jgi:hypothetical protein
VSKKSAHPAASNGRVCHRSSVTESVSTTVCVTIVRYLMLVFLLVGMAIERPATLLAQSDNSSIAGTITDPSGAVVSGASITVISELTSAEHKTVSNRSGYYTIAGLAPGKYTVRVSAAGFSTVSRSNNNLDPSVPATVNLSLAVGETAQQVSVTAEETTVQADSSTLGRVITSNQAENIPLNGRNPLNLALTKAGITSATNTLSSFSYSTGLGALNINGGRERSNLVSYDGAVAVRVRASGDSIGVPDLDAVQEVQILATNYPAEYGRSTGGQVRIITKGGGNRFHGSLYEYLRNPKLDANTWTRNANPNNANPNYPAALKTNFVAPYTFNQFGYNVNGPLYIPHVLPKGKVFFLFSQAFVRYPQTLTNPAIVPNAALRTALTTGDFSAVTTSWLRNPKLGLPCDAKSGAGGGCYPQRAKVTGTPSPNGLALLNVFPTATPGFQVGSNNLLQIGRNPVRQQIDSGSLDIIPNDKNYIRFRLVHFFYYEDNPFSAAYSLVPRIYNRPNQTGSLDWVYSISPHTTNEVLVTASHDAARLDIDTSSGLYDRTRYGVNYPFLFPNGKDLPNKIPTIQFDNTSITTMDGSPFPSHSQGQIFDLADTVTRTLGNHTLRGGFLYERSGENDRDQIAFQNSIPGQTNNQNGRFEFSNTNPAGTGLDVADAYLGLFASYAEVGPRAQTPYRANMYEFFAQDSYKATPKLHLDYGLRYTIIRPYYSLWNNIGTFDPAFYNPASAVAVDKTTGNPIAGSGDPLNGTVLFGNGFTDSAKAHVPIAASGQYNNLFHNLPRGYVNVQYTTFQPRLGIAYQINSKTVLRSGFGRYMNRQGVSDGVFEGGIPPLQQVAAISSGSVDNPGGAANGSYPTLSGSISRNSPNPEAYTWSISLERELGFGTVANVSYVGRRGLHEQFQSNINQPQPGTQQAIGSKTNINAYRPYLGYGPITRVTQSDGASYQGLQVDVNHRFTRGLGFGVAYTFAKSTDCGSFQKNFLPNYYDPKAVCGPADYDVRHVLVVNAVYELPFFRTGNRILREALGGWQLTQADQFQTGTPFSVATSSDIAGVGTGGGPQLLAINPGVALGGNRKFSTGSDSNFYYNLAAFSYAPAGTFTSQRNRNVLRNPGIQSWNAGLLKRFPTFEGQNLIFRFEAFNFINHSNLSPVDATFTDANFGRVVSKTGQRQMQASLRYSF